MSKPFLVAGAETRRNLQGGGLAKRMLKRIVEEQQAWTEQVNVAMERGSELRREYVKGGQDMLNYIADVLLEMLPDPVPKDGESGEEKSATRGSD